MRSQPFSRRLLKSPAALAVAAEVVGVERYLRQRIVGTRIPYALRLKALETSLPRRRGESWKLSVGMWQSAHERPLPPSRPQVAIEEGPQPAQHCIARLAVATRIVGSRTLVEAEQGARATTRNRRARPSQGASAKPLFAGRAGPGQRPCQRHLRQETCGWSCS
jgi:hypothetical protein